MRIDDKLKVLALKKAYDFLEKDPVNNAMKVLGMARDLANKEILNAQFNAVEKMLNEPDSNWHQFYRSIFEDVDPGIRKKIFENWLINATIIGNRKHKELEKKYDCNMPWAILLDPTSACNLQCIGCWAAEYGNKLNLSLEQLDDIIKQAKELGTYFFIYSGGEPLVRKKDIITLCELHDDCQFFAFTNGTLIDEEFADEILRVKNFTPAFSVEGFEAATDARRGNGTFQRALKGMQLLKERKVPFGISCCYTSQNVDVIGSDEYFDAMIEWGAKFVWLFTYIPVGKDAVPELMVTPEQRKFMYHKIREFRQTKPIFTIDFWNDGDYVGGCIAGGKSYLHINANGDIEPCAFIHYANYNIKETPLLDALQGPLFKAYRAGQPFNDNLLRPCPLLDNPERLREMVEASGAYSTDLIAPEDVRDLTGKCEATAEKWAVVADELWAERHACAACKAGCAAAVK